ncbi:MULTISPECIES: EAL domain-containing protein [unclassified Sphingobium]|uniref:EAL domain-containing protein n=1 Tax=unclassified Sphingobium TaxID=2611147 RepID=UPI0022246BFE|nr:MULTISPECIES: EAL domain-containing protein [unclassified Sphingobium]MCW2412731.1 EAL domain-containing protein (putative c-di-GMP-specific phosphodiesterase class I) [Sphingobium sp. B8D3D]MCW2414971.1 EAL domain-containing protein (putative c-di-GMP-specific phosphodiesterase class I) [Sphingobium sp. B8D3A]
MAEQAAVYDCRMSAWSATPLSSFAMLAFRLDNLTHLVRAYGEGVRPRAVDFVHGMLRDAVGSRAVVDRSVDGLVSTVILDPGLFGGRDMSEASCAQFVRDFGARVAAVPFTFEGVDLHVAVSGAWSLTNDVQADPHLEASGEILRARLSDVRFIGEPSAAGADWVRRYKADMARASWLLSAMSHGRLLPVWQPVRSGCVEDTVLYHEALLRVLDDGQQVSAGEAIGALERLGLVEMIDRHGVERVIEELRRDPDVCLAVNISAQSAWLSPWWSEVAEQLRRDPDLASRLIVEVTETAQFRDMGQAVTLVACLRKLGVRVALDDFGVGHASLRSLLALQPDIIKIDAFFLRRAIGSEPDRVALHHLIGLAGSFVADVVVEGVETEEEFDLAREAGAIWLQGYHMGRPSVVRPWFKDAVQTNVLALFEKRQAYREAGWSVPG